MKQRIFYVIWTLLCLHVTVTFAASVDTDTLSGVELQSAPSYIYHQAVSPIPQTDFNAWEMIHRSAMLAGLTWSGGGIENFITPKMYIGTPIKTNMTKWGYTVDIGPTNYTECVRAETTASFGVDGSLIEQTYEDEIRNIAKYCATEFLGSYFHGKTYTTREETLLFLFTLFEENDIGLPGYFDMNTFVSDGRSIQTPFKNVSPKAWYAPYLARATTYNMIDSFSDWQVAREISNEELHKMINEYLGGESSIQTPHGTYDFIWENQSLIITKQ